ncbi:MAG: hypothetical protein PHE29_05790 [Tissierellia bacterium]|nr:hypothetical protein [Tissierellia bacterium]MDD4781149.1 hypothetical protein [Tissierellia bacterium]
MFEVGQGILGKIKYVDGTLPNKNRTYIIVDVSEDGKKIKVLNVSSVKGKEHKLAFPSNQRLKKYNPPFLRDSFVKLDSLSEVDASDFSSIMILNNGNKLDCDEMNTIIQGLSAYNTLKCRGTY